MKHCTPVWLEGIGFIGVLINFLDVMQSMAPSTCVAAYNEVDKPIQSKVFRHKIIATHLAVIILAGATFNVIFPDIPGCGALSTDLQKAKDLACTALSEHLKGMLEDGEPLPEAKTSTIVVDDVLGPDESLVEVSKFDVKLEY